MDNIGYPHDSLQSSCGLLSLARADNAKMLPGLNVAQGILSDSEVSIEESNVAVHVSARYAQEAGITVEGPHEEQKHHTASVATGADANDNGDANQARGEYQCEGEPFQPKQYIKEIKEELHPHSPLLR
mmetsp:Transcript_1126/g.2287  ORF Transcript_1126/g.2287 Transcript_1126/m.2287 type:complete len:129 (+) Transcript_1126:110-496(+)|eukprot:CAMPEP_0197633154 /NCGR_PEP_ID=MMETSP1338-20131121/9574_1 /TAXON_ID=43686 ORGANISM="Pelagodinium beii, Strain RCC1491" /NCGR_SAMPLE_ID=MMETSP1338 /ASSEMBLY_ACC=CAM_ASM_000754 /LENGTH=128 /DNA_ID=CAMNT_0043204749 /DNA_START=63 /DNA_END=449 /DNA_ORIENTATION=-